MPSRRARSPKRNATVREIAVPTWAEAVRGASDAPRRARRAAYAEMAWLAHLGLMLFWVGDETPQQSATGDLIEQVRALAPFLKLGPRTPVVGGRLLGVMKAVAANLSGGKVQG